MEGIKGVIFDFNGVLADDAELHTESFTQVCRAHNIPFKRGEYRKFCFGIADEEGFQAVLNARGMKAPVQQLVLEKHTVYMKKLPKVRMIPGASRAVRLFARKYPLAVASCALKPEVEAVLKRFRIRHCFKAVIGMGDFKRGKPSPEPYQVAANRLGIKPGMCLAIEDTPTGITSAKKAGFRCIGLMTSMTKKALAGADYICADFARVETLVAEAHKIYK